ncbi:2OG-Fe(II) oxygenase [Chromatiales bacterium (ex Bugula neritina AB1)]|nr:2OG-Fe(II) oxygenase [Chromatiales bacterium (ex Bugula neritina AB1)]
MSNENKLKAVDYKDADAPARFVESLRTTGFGVLVNHPLPQVMVDSIYTNWQAFFDNEEKNNYQFDTIRYDGFFPAQQAEAAKGRKVRDIKEYYHFYPWGQCPAALRDELLDYYTVAGNLASELLGWVEAQSPADVKSLYSEPLPSMMHGSEQSLLRVLHYPPLQGDEVPDAIRASAHEDINLLTVLPAANEPGLQVKQRDGTWLDVPCDFGNLIVNIGDMLQEVSGGYFPSTTHRVINPDGAKQNRSRISLPLFLHPRPEVVLSERYTAGSYLQERLAELREAEE